RLEYEGRYRAMFSHEVKNYALLTYSGQLGVRGVALRSSRAEPFGERFLRQALLCTMTNDITGVRDAYLTTVNALRRRSLSTSDLGARIRLSKTPTAYMASRATHPEPQYEALLAAGRTNWYPGERVRFYRARGKSYVWLPEENIEASINQPWEPETKTDKTNAQHRQDYDVEHYLQVLVTSYAARLRKAFLPDDFEQLFRLDGQSGLFDRPIEHIQPRWIRCQQNSSA
ncbi:MAG: DNA polymerase, partial [Ktedonobacteraceae bacterium]